MSEICRSVHQKVFPVQCRLNFTIKKHSERGVTCTSLFVFTGASPEFYQKFMIWRGKKWALCIDKKIGVLYNFNIRPM